MVKILDNINNPKSLIMANYIWKFALVGLLVGLLYWLSISIFTRFLPLSLSSDISVILLAILGISSMVLLKMTQPLLVGLSASLVLWGLAFWSEGLYWLEIVVWDMVLYSLAYILFSWVAKYSKVAPVIISIIAIIVIARVAIML